MKVLKLKTHKIFKVINDTNTKVYCVYGRIGDMVDYGLIAVTIDPNKWLVVRSLTDFNNNLILDNEELAETMAFAWAAGKEMAL